jgi:sugar/nucleoside kinase (ribokinase family)
MRPIGVVGNLSLDRVETGKPRPGGGPYHCARALRALGRRGVLVAKSAEADRRELLTPLVCLGLPVFWRPAETTARFSMSYEGDIRHMTVDELGPRWTEDDARGWATRALTGVEWVHVAPLARTDFPPETLDELARGRRLSLDGQGLVRPGRPGPLELDADYDPAVLRSVSLLKLAEDEARLVLNSLDESSLRALGVAEVVVTLGSEGALVLSAAGLEHVAARAVQGEVDPTGAGDAFIAAYLAARAQGQAPAASANRASALVADLLSGRLR